MRTRMLIFILGVAILSSCINTPNHSLSYNNESAECEYEEIRLTGNIEVCNKCKGYGLVQETLYSSPTQCKFCVLSTIMRINEGWDGFNGRFGLVDAVFNTLPPDYFDNISLDGEGADYSENGIDNASIERQIEWHEENIAQIERQLEYVEGIANRSYLEQQLIEERYEIRRLKMLLNN